MSASDVESIVLDPSICRWVLFPIMLMMVLIGILRHYITLLVARSSKPECYPDFLELRESLAVHRSINLRRNAAQLPLPSVLVRRNFFFDAFSKGDYLKEKPKEKSSLTTSSHNCTSTDNNEEQAPEVPAGPDPAAMEAMMDGMKKNMLMIIPQTVIMTLITYFFSGFLLTRLPFPLTVRFKTMLQSGIQTPDLDASWVSSLSWYFLNLFGLNPVFRLILGHDNAADSSSDLTAMNPLAAHAISSSANGAVNDVQMPEMPQKGMASMPGSQTTFEKTFASETEFLELLNVSENRAWICDGIEERVYRLLKAVSKSE